MMQQDRKIRKTMIEFNFGRGETLRARSSILR